MLHIFCRVDDPTYKSSRRAGMPHIFCRVDDPTLMSASVTQRVTHSINFNVAFDDLSLLTIMGLNVDPASRVCSHPHGGGLPDRTGGIFERGANHRERSGHFAGIA